MAKGPVVKSAAQAKAIALSVARKEGGGQKKVGVVMREFEAGKLHSGSGKKKEK
jgi:hypothetical protein